MRSASRDHQPSRNIRSPKLRADAAKFKARDVGLEICRRLGNIDLVEGEIRFHPHFVGQVVVAIDQNGVAMNPPGFG